MVRLSRIYTKTGDDGSTGLGDGSRLPKHHVRIQAYGTLDELNATLGLALADGCDQRSSDWLRTIQNDLFDAGSDLCVPGEGGDKLRIPDAYTTRLESWIDEVNADLEPLDSFILPGGTRLAAGLHVARTVCRRAERGVTELASLDSDNVNPVLIRYLNRLSDLLFVMARSANDGGKADIPWVPGGGSDQVSE